MQPAYQGLGEAWICHDIGNGQFAIEFRSGEAGHYLSHAINNVSLQPAYQGALGSMGKYW